MQGTTMLTSVGMFGRSSDGSATATAAGGGGYGIGFLTVHTVGMTVGGIARRPAVTDDGRVEAREFLNLTLSFDHDIVDGAPAARFIRRLVEIIEAAAVLDEPDRKVSSETDPPEHAS
jgi:pyruvate/2-oxoglutarate dehydrogenase complex dihydrolipoamide acyltransferase (E2) component